MNLWVGALALGLAFAASALGVFLTFRVLAFPDLTVDGSFNQLTVSAGKAKTTVNVEVR